MNDPAWMPSDDEIYTAVFKSRTKALIRRAGLRAQIGALETIMERPHFKNEVEEMIDALRAELERSVTP